MRWLVNFYVFRLKWTATAAIGIHPTKAPLSQLVNFARNWRCRRFVLSFSQGCLEKIRKKDIVMTAGRWLSWSIQISQFSMLWWHVMKAGSTAMTQGTRDRFPSESMLDLPDPRRPDRANAPTNFWWSLFLTALAWSTCTRFPLDKQSTRNTMLRF